MAGGGGGGGKIIQACFRDVPIRLIRTEHWDVDIDETTDINS